MNCVMAIQAGPGDETGVRGAHRRTGKTDESLISAVRGPWMPGPVVAVLAKIRNLLVQQLCVGRAVRSVTRKAVLLHSRMLEQERAPLLRMAAFALYVYGFMFDHPRTYRTVGIVATGAGNLSFYDGMMRRLVNLDAGLFMAGNTGLVFKLPFGVDERIRRGIFARNRDR